MTLDSSDLSVSNGAQNADRQTRHPVSGGTRLMIGNLMRASVAALGIANAACTSLPDPSVAASQDQDIEDLNRKLEKCGDLQDFQNKGGIISEGTLGVRRLYHDRENIFRLTPFVTKVDQVFMPWPSPYSQDAITVEGDGNKLSAVQIGSYWGVQFKADYESGVKSKDAFVIQNSMTKHRRDLDPLDSRIHRYVIIIERR